MHLTSWNTWYERVGRAGFGLARANLATCERYQIAIFDWPYVLDQFRSYGIDRPVRRRSSGQLYIRCLFHSERTPSLVLYPTGYFHCFGCGEEGWFDDFVAGLQDFYVWQSLTTSTWLDVDQLDPRKVVRDNPDQLSLFDDLA